MIKLEPIIEKFKHQYVLVERNDYAALYEAKMEINGELRRTSYETFKIKVKKENEIFGKKYESAEQFPGHEVFGKWAFSYGPNMLKEARIKFLELSKPETETESKTVDIKFEGYLIRYYKERDILVVIKDKKIIGDQKRIITKYCKEVLKMLPEELEEMTVKSMVRCIIGD